MENLNSVLDDNKLLTLPNGERLNIPSNVRIMFEVQDKKYAALATVSRCGMIWFSEDVLSLEMIYENYFLRLSNVPLEGNDDEDAMTIAMTAAANSDLKLERSISKAGETLPALTANNAVAPATPEVSSTLALQRSAAV